MDPNKIQEQARMEAEEKYPIPTEAPNSLIPEARARQALRQEGYAAALISERTKNLEREKKVIQAGNDMATAITSIYEPGRLESADRYQLTEAVKEWEALTLSPQDKSTNTTEDGTAH